MTAETESTQVVGRRLEVTGTVQGVGFRPFVYRLARSLGLGGTVRNDGGTVVIDAVGAAASLDDFLRRLHDDAPPHARVGAIDVSPLDAGAWHSSAAVPFTIVPSTTGAADTDPQRRLIPPDLATCPDCQRELLDPADRRFRYPFINCTNCGPRATIIVDLPYDRDSTTMADFELCPTCRAEYEDPANRRFHAEPVACPACGPRLVWVTTGPATETAPTATADAALRAAEAVIANGGIVAVKGLGGYQLVCDATSSQAVARLRAGKARWDKPFAVMVRDLAAARRVAEVSDAESALLTSSRAPIVVLQASGGDLAPGVHPGIATVGVFLPTTPLHHLLLADLGQPLIVTSGNRSDEPIAIDEAGASVLAPLVDGFLHHERAIAARYDDSVARVVGGAPMLIRRVRGYAPEPIDLPVAAPQPLLAAGAELKHTFTLAAGRRAFIGPHTGDLEELTTFEAFEGNLRHLRRILGVHPLVVAHDLHPAYLSTRWARDNFPAHQRLAVQHHHAHVAACMAEHGLTGPVLGVAFDGLGMGDDGTLWGGEVLLATLSGYRRVGRFGRAPLPGGAAAIRRPVRMALGYLYGAENPDGGLPGIGGDAAYAFCAKLDIERAEHDAVRAMVARGINSPLASSAGRLFDAAAAVLGLRSSVTYEGQAAVELEAAACQSPLVAAELPWRIVDGGALSLYDPRPTLQALLEGAAAGTSVAVLAAGFHRAVTAATVALCEASRTRTSCSTVCLTGGVFQNRLLSDALAAALTDDGFTVFRHSAVPANDGGISYGQAAIAAATLAER